MRNCWTLIKGLASDVYRIDFQGTYHPNNHFLSVALGLDYKIELENTLQ